MDELIPVINLLHDVCSDVKLDMKLNLPQIAVVGSQSSGKSSVLENIVGKDFLPRGSGIVTRCPLVLQLVQLPKTREEEWGEFHHKPGKKFSDFSEIRREIELRTCELAGEVAITDRPISLKIYSPHVLTLTLVDLPGLVMNAVGDQPKDIDRQIKDMVTKYVTPANTIILAVTPANADLATSAALRVAKQVDPEGVRTVGVLTKLDLMDRGTDATDMLSGKTMPLRRGFVGVVNRSQQDINDKKGIEAARADERAFFESHPAYRAMASRQGTEFLSKSLSTLLLEHIQAALPSLVAHVDQATAKAQKDMEKLGMIEQPGVERSAVLLQLIKQFSDGLNDAIEGGVSESSTELVGGARLDYVFHEKFAPYVRSLTAAKDLSDEHIRVNMRNMAGMSATLFPSDQVFITLSRQQIQKLEDPCLKCVGFILDELIAIVTMCAAKLERYPTLRSRITQLCVELIQSCRAATQAQVKLQISAEKGYVNLRHPVVQDLVGRVLSQMSATRTEAQAQAAGGAAVAAVAPAASNADAMGPMPKKIVLGTPLSTNEKAQFAAIRDMVEGYFGVVQRNVADQVPKAITLLMITKLREETYAVLVQELYKSTLFEELLAEAPDIAQQRKRVSERMKYLARAQQAIAKVRDFVPAAAPEPPKSS